MNNQIDYVEVSLLEILPHLPVIVMSYNEEGKFKEHKITHITLERLEYYDNEEVVIFHHEGERKEKHRQLHAYNTRGALTAKTLYIPYSEAQRINIDVSNHFILIDGNIQILEKKTYVTTDSDTRPAVKQCIELIQYETKNR